jgi:hypothetical protein
LFFYIYFLGESKAGDVASQLFSMAKSKVKYEWSNKLFVSLVELWSESSSGISIENIKRIQLIYGDALVLPTLLNRWEVAVAYIELLFTMLKKK